MGALLWLATIMLARGGTLSILWAWFIAGAGAPFEGQAPHLNVGEALGVSLVVTFLTSSPKDLDHGDVDRTEQIARAVVFYVAVWVLALAVRLVTA